MTTREAKIVSRAIDLLQRLLVKSKKQEVQQQENKRLEIIPLTVCIVARYYGIDTVSVYQKSRRADCVLVRHVVIYMLRHKYPEISIRTLADYLGMSQDGIYNAHRQASKLKAIKYLETLFNKKIDNELANLQ